MRRTYNAIYRVITSDTFLLLISAAMIGLLFAALLGGWGGVIG